MKLFRHGPLLCLAASAVLSSQTALGDPRPPNLVFILADDLGWSGLGCIPCAMTLVSSMTWPPRNPSAPRRSEPVSISGGRNPVSSCLSQIQIPAPRRPGPAPDSSSGVRALTRGPAVGQVPVPWVFNPL